MRDTTLTLIQKHIAEQQAMKDGPVSIDRLTKALQRQYTEMAEHAGRLEDALEPSICVHCGGTWQA